MPVQRPYFMIFNGAERMVEAPNPAGAVRHVVGAAVTELRPARGAEVAAWVRGGRSIELAGVSAATEAEAAGSAGAAIGEADGGGDDPTFNSADAFDWLSMWTTRPTAEILPIWTAMAGAGRMTLEDFDRLRVAVPKFGEAVVAAIDGVDGKETALAAGLADVRGQLEDQPFDMIVVVGAIGEAKRRELFEDEPPSGGPTN